MTSPSSTREMVERLKSAHQLLHRRPDMTCRESCQNAIQAGIDALTASMERERELKEAILELQREACARDGVPMPSERPLVDKLRERVNELEAVTTNMLAALDHHHARGKTFPARVSMAAADLRRAKEKQNG